MTERRGFYKQVVRPGFDVLEKTRVLPSEKGHTRVRDALGLVERSEIALRMLCLFTGVKSEDREFSPRLYVDLGNLTLYHPVMVGAGWDKLGVAVRALWWLGFSAVEIGAVLPKAQPGNPKPRQFMLAQGVALNRLGFNAPGVEAVSQNLRRYKEDDVPIGINLGINKETSPEEAPDAYASVVRFLYKQASYFTINVSSPNTPGLRNLQGKEHLEKIVAAVNAAMDERGRRKPTFIKIAPDLEDSAVTDVIQIVFDHKLTGIVATNTTINPDIKAKYGERWRNEAGGLSGDDADFRRMATHKVAFIYNETQGKMTIIGVGGVKDGWTAWEKITAGASAVQVVTGLRGEGLGVAKNINRGLLEIMRRRGLGYLSDAVGTEAKALL